MIDTIDGVREEGEHRLSLRLAVIAVLVLVLGFRGRGTFLDDALIYARYVSNALHGLGLVFNPGEHVNALTSPLYSYLVLATAWLTGGRVLLASVLVSGLALFAACLLAEVLVPFAGLLIASTGYFYGLVGMETSLFLCLLLLNLWLLQQDQLDYLPSAGLLLVLTRFEGAALLLPLAFVLAKRRRWPRPRAFAPVLLLAIVYLGLNQHWYGAPLPASASAKFGQGRSELWGRWPWAFLNTAYQMKSEFLPTLYVVIAVALLGIAGAWQLRRVLFVGLSLTFLGVLFAFYLLFNIPGYKWYYAPFVMFAMLYSCAVIPSLPRPHLWRYALVLMIASSAGTAYRHLHRTFPADVSTATVGYPAIAHWLDLHAAPGARVEAAEIGTLGFFCPRCDVQDILGLTSPKNADHVAHKDLNSWLAEDRPQYIVMHHGRWSFEDVARTDPAYAPVPFNFGDVVYLLERKPTQAGGER